MKSISTRLAVWYATAATTTLAGLFVVGYLLLQHNLIHGIDILNRSEAEVIKLHLMHDYDPYDAALIERRIRKASERTASLFYINVRDQQSGATFYSSNLKGQPIADGGGQKIFNTEVSDIGKLRVVENVSGPFTITVGTPLRGVDLALEEYIKVCLALLAGMLLISIIVGMLLSRLALRPVRMISETANRIRSDNLSERIPVNAVRDEISDLAKMLNQTFDRLESSFNQIRRFSAEASHELKTPLSLIRLYSEKMLLGGGLSPANEEAVQLQLEEVARLNQIIEEMLFLSRAEAHAITLDLKQVSPVYFLNSFAQDARVLAESQGRLFAHNHTGAGMACFDEKRMRQVFLNLLTNALGASPPGGSVTLRSQLDDGIWRICVEDEGRGLPVEQHERIFERFVRLNPPGSEDKGNGLGLAICRSIVGLHHGRIFASSGTNNIGLQITIEIPASML
ncbi:two-component system, OmpR family, heavy metal sensor histidine kinase CusS [Collimonas sp. OK307]|uniref:sensor histidine kinase n=1 Tax=Collimonas sp. OK307 TaxID=1801620 RepID=UPI0008EF6147|nr:ATP-binding protein [Collimonas sp. OK307]SFH68158.1 two-component system, OmpR family, heavy metal sensor histidine kinase CusS [Collimonas sp. OK307]